MTQTLLSVDHLDKHFTNKQVLNAVSFNIQKGHIVGLIGANGAGKTTIMKAILGITPFNGSIKLNDQTITISQHQALKTVGALVEYLGLYPYLTGREQLTLFATGTDRQHQVNQIIEQLKMTNYANLKTKQYSLGMKQKLGIGLALLNQPELVILDEPMNGLDPRATKDLRDLILAAKAHGTTFLISSHLLSELQRIADDVLIIDHGTLITDTTMPALLASNQHYYQLKTDQDQDAKQLLQTAGYQLTAGPDIQIAVTPEFKLNPLLQLLLTNHVNLLSIQQQTGDLEESLLTMLTDHTGNTKGAN